MANIVEYIPPVVKNIREVRNICHSIDKELERMSNAYMLTYDNQFFDTMDDNTCTRWENMMRIEFDSTYTLEERRARIKSRFVEQLPYTKTTIKHILTTICGEGGFLLDINNEAFTVTIKIGLANKNTFNDVCDMISRIIPANMILDVSILYNTHETLSQFTHETLSNYTHKQLREEVITERR